MPTIREKVFTALVAGSPSPLRVHQVVMPQYPVLPAVTYEIVGGEDDIHLTGHGGTARRLVQIDVWGRTGIGVEETMDIVKTQMLAASDFTVGRIDVSGAPTYESATEFYRESAEFSISYET